MHELHGCLGPSGRDLFTELQIWRPGSEDGFYTKVGSTAIMAERNTTRLYEYRLSSPGLSSRGCPGVLPACWRASSQLRLLVEGEGRVEHQLGYYYDADSPGCELNISGPGDNRSIVLILLMLLQVSEILNSNC